MKTPYEVRTFQVATTKRYRYELAAGGRVFRVSAATYRSPDIAIEQGVIAARKIAKSSEAPGLTSRKLRA